MDESALNLKRELIKKRRTVKEKLRQLKEGEVIKEESFLPITKRLQSIATTLQGDDKSIKTEPIFKEERKTKSQISKFEDGDYEVDYIKAPVIAEHVPDPVDYERDVDMDLEPNIQEAKEYIQSFSGSPHMESYLAQLESLPRQYIEQMFRDVDNEFDYKYGVHYNPEENILKIGNATFAVLEKNILINDLLYKGTPGLYELLFKKHPSGYLPTDLKNYFDILNRTSAHRRNYSENGQIQGNASYKYKHIISQLAKQTWNTPRRLKITSNATKKRLGEGIMMELTNSNTDYVYWDDPNEIVDRLRLLVASQTAGHTGHSNEINSIIEELREAKIIS